MSEHLKLSLNTKVGILNLREIEKSLALPPRDFPASFKIKRENCFCAGYFLGYDLKLNPDQIADYCQKGKWETLANTTADFLIIFADYEKEELFILTSQTGAFPCYFSINNLGVFISTDFGWVKENISSLTLNLDFALDYLSLFRLLRETTVFDEILQIPPAVLLKIDKNLNHSFKPLIDIDKFLEPKQTPFVSKKEYTDNFLEVFSKVISERLSAIGDFSFASDLSSGLDVNLVCYLLKKISKNEFMCYSRITKFAHKDTNYKLMLDFVKKHNLNIKVLKAEEYFPFSTEHELKWLLKYFYPFDHGLEMDYQLNLGVANDANTAKFTGDGGDEIYKVPEWEKTAKFALQDEYFQVVKACRGGVERLLTPKGLKLILNKDRFAQKTFFPTVLPSSPVMIGLLYFPICWELRVWPISPFNDPRMVQFGRRIPQRSSGSIPKKDIWKGRTDIFLDGQLSEKGHFGEHIGLYLKKKSDFVISVLENSVLAQAGIVRADEIIADIKAGKIIKYYNEPFSVLDNLIRLEYYLQANNVKVT